MTTVRDDRWASGATYETYIGRWSRLVAPRFIAWLEVPVGRRWLDIGCGTGALTATILDHADPTAVTGIDPSDAFVGYAREAVRDARATFAQGTAAATGVGDATMDVAVSGLVLNFVPDVGDALAEARRVVVPGGTVAGYVWDYAAGMQFLRRFWDAAISLDSAARELDEAVRFPLTAAGALGRAFESAGLAKVAVTEIDVPTGFDSFEDLWMPFLGGTGPAPAYVASLDEAHRVALRERLRADVPIANDGSISLMARAWAIKARTPG